MRYRTIVADPPWEYDEGFALASGRTVNSDGVQTYRGPIEVRDLPYDSMSLADIRSLPVQDLAEADSRLFLWTTNRYLPDSFGVLDFWGFKYRQTLVWHKTDANMPASVAPNSAEFVLVGTRGSPARGTTMPSAVIARPRDGGPGTKSHSKKPECFLDFFEMVSQPPYLELFARRQRLGWDTWGHEALEHVEMGV